MISFSGKRLGMVDIAQKCLCESRTVGGDWEDSNAAPPPLYDFFWRNLYKV